MILADLIISIDQIRDLKKKYNLRQMTSEQGGTLIQDLQGMGALNTDDFDECLSTSGNILEVINRQFSADITRLYRMAIAGKYCTRHIERLQREQKLLNLLEQLAD